MQKDTKKKIFKYLFSIIIIFLSVYFVGKDVDLVKLWEILVNVNYTWVLVSIPIVIMSHWIRAIRWKTMLVPAHKTKSASTWNLFSAVMIGYLFNSILPRGGEFIRPYVYSRREKVSFSTTFATIIAERFIDVLTLMLLFGTVFLFMRERIFQALPQVDPNKMLVTSAILILVLVMSFYPPFIRTMIKILIKPFSIKNYEKINQLFEKFIKGFAIIKLPSLYFRLTLESLLIWFLYTVPMFLTFYCFTFQQTYHLGFQDAILMIIISGIGVTIAPTPGAIGVFHFLITNALMRFYGLKQEEALAYATLNHAINYVTQVVVGGLFFLRENIKSFPNKEELAPELEAS